MEEAAYFRTEPLCEFPSENPLSLMSTPQGRDASSCGLHETYTEIFLRSARDLDARRRMWLTDLGLPRMLWNSGHY
jgi:hypothetical protein